MHHTIFQRVKYYNEYMDEQLQEKRNDGGDSFVAYFQRSFAQSLNERLSYDLDWMGVLNIATSVGVSCSETLYTDEEKDEVRKLADHFTNVVIMMYRDLVGYGTIDTRILKNLASTLSISLD